MIPVFPDFSPLHPDHRAELEAVTSQFPPYSDFNFVSLYCWNTAGSVAISRLNDNIVVRFSDYVTGHPFYSFIGSNDPGNTAHALLERMREEGEKPHIKLLPHDCAPGEHPAFVRTEDPDNFDYILSIERLKTYEGSQLKPNRNLATRFRKSYQSHTRQLDLQDPAVKAALLQFFHEWAQRKGLPPDQTENEFRAIARAFDPDIAPHLLGIAVDVDGAMAGFSIYERLPGPYAMLHFEKADPKRCVGIYQHLMQETARVLGESGAQFINYQQDLGLPGLKTCKRGFHPCDHLRKVRLSWNENL